MDIELPMLLDLEQALLSSAEEVQTSDF